MQGMPEFICVVCDKKNAGVSMHCIPTDSTTREEWIKALVLDAKAVQKVCSGLFPGADSHKKPDKFGKLFASLRKHLLQLHRPVGKGG